jgi:hypothetical protein
MHRPEVTRQAKGEPRNPGQTFLWLYYLKDEVNKSLNPPVVSVPYKEFRARYMLHDGHLLNDVEVANLLVLVAIEAKDLKRDAEFVQFCNHLSPLLPVAMDSVLPYMLAEKPNCAVTTFALDISNEIRRSRGLPCRTLKHYKDWGNI